MSSQIAEVKSTAAKDDDGLYIIEKDNALILIFNALKEKADWDKVCFPHIESACIT